MHIQNYQIQNVLNVFRRSLSRHGAAAPRCDVPGRIDSESAAALFSLRSAHPSIMDKVAANVIQRVTRIDPENNSNTARAAPRLTAKTRRHRGRRTGVYFLFNTIVGGNRKEARSMAVNDSHVLMNRLDELVQAAVKRSTGESPGSAAGNGHR